MLSFYNGCEKFKIKLIRTTKTIQGLDKLILVVINWIILIGCQVIIRMELVSWQLGAVFEEFNNLKLFHKFSKIQS